MKLTRRHCVIAALAAATLGTFLTLSLFVQDRVTATTHENLRIGMSASEVYALIGHPDQIENGEKEAESKLLNQLGEDGHDRIKGSKALTYFGSDVRVRLVIDNRNEVRSIGTTNYFPSNTESLRLILQRVAGSFMGRSRVTAAL